MITAEVALPSMWRVGRRVGRRVGP
jgi:hypothetical protein